MLILILHSNLVLFISVEDFDIIVIIVVIIIIIIITVIFIVYLFQEMH